MRSTVVTASRSPQIGDGLTYDATGAGLTEGDLVTVTLRKKIMEGVVTELNARAEKEAFAVKPITERLGNVLPPAQAKLAKWMAEEYFCSARSVLSIMLPSPPWKSLLPSRVIGYELTKENGIAPKGKKQMSVIDFLKNRSWTEFSAIREATGASVAIIKALVEKGWLTASERVEKLEILSAHRALPKAISIDARASLAFEDRRPTLCRMPLAERRAMYLSFVAEALRRGRQAIVLYPEVMLAEEAAKAFTETFGEGSVTLLHSRLTPSQRKEEWRNIHAGKSRVVVGTRTALFAPCRELGLVIIDDEQEWTYKSEETPRYLARPVAEKLCVLASAKLVIGSAVPSVDVFAKTLSAEYALLETKLPVRSEARVIDLAGASFNGNYPFTPVLLRSIAETLQRGEQSLLLFNRRGAGTALICEDCRRRVVSKDGNVPLTVHQGPRGTPYLIDHATGAQAGVPAVCPSCKSPRLKIIGAGTQTVEDILKKMFPAARILRSDRDVASPEETEKMLKLLREKKADILLGTRSILKSLELPSVTLAAILLADTGLSIPDFRAGERVFQTIAQLMHMHAGKPGRTVILQTYRPDAPEIALAARGDDARYLQEEASLRTIMGYPPATRMVRLLLRGPDAKARANAIVIDIKKNLPKGAAVVASPTFHDQRIFQVVLRAPDPHTILKSIDLRSAVVDVDPLETA